MLLIFFDICLQTKKLFENRFWCNIFAIEVKNMKILKVIANGFKNCADDFEISFIPLARKTSEDKEYELQEIADGLFVYSTIGVIGKNASGKTSVKIGRHCKSYIMSITSVFVRRASPSFFDRVLYNRTFWISYQNSGGT